MLRCAIVTRLVLAIAVMALPGPTLVSVAEAGAARRYGIGAYRHSLVVVVQQSVTAFDGACASSRSKGPSPHASMLLMIAASGPGALAPALGSWMETGSKPDPPPGSSCSVPRGPPPTRLAPLLG